MTPSYVGLISGTIAALGDVIALEPTDDVPPTAPTGLIAASRDSAVVLTWNASTDAVGVTDYSVYRDGVRVALLPGRTFTDAGRTNGTSYSYQVTALDDARNESDFSNTATATPAVPTDTTPPSVPASVVATAGANRVTLTWSSSSDDVAVTGYKIRRNGGSAVLATVTSGNSYTNTGLNNGQSYSYTVSAVDAAGNESAQSSSATATPTAGTLLFLPTYDSANQKVMSVAPQWGGEQEMVSGPYANQALQTVPLSTVPAGPLRPTSGFLLQVDMRPGDHVQQGTYTSHRAEMSAGGKFTATEGQERWVGWEFYFDPDTFPFDGGPASGDYIDILQWKGNKGSSPPVAIGLPGGPHIDKGTTDADPLFFSKTKTPLTKGVWHQIVLGVYFHRDKTLGWVQCYLDGSLVVPKTFRRTLDSLNSADVLLKPSAGMGAKPDSVYFKQGVYRSGDRDSQRHRYWVGPVRGGTSYAQVAR